MKKIKKYTLILSLFLASILSLGFVDNFFEISKNLDIFSSLYKELNIYYVDETDSGDLMKTAIDAMLESLDPYTTYIPESEKEDFEFMTTGQYGGIGAVITKNGDWVYVSEPYEGFPADKAGLIAGDKFVEIAGKSVEGKSTEDVSKVLKGEPNTSVKVLIEREGVKKPFEVEITRQEIKLNSVPYYGMVSDSIGYIKTRSFTRNISKEVSDAYNELNSDNQLKGLVLDLRSNPGGLLNEAIKMSNLFIDQGQEIVFTKGKVKEWDKSYKTRSTALDTTMPLVVLINRSSASASEIVSGAIQDLDRGVVLGQRSFGKGLVQRTFDLKYGSKLKLTISKYYTPSGRCVQRLEYYDKDSKAKAAEISDTLLSKFQTRNGREVIDGRGIVPDININKALLSRLSSKLLVENMIFNFATDYKSSRDSIAEPESFDLSDLDFKAFVDFVLLDEAFTFQTGSELKLEELKETAKEEGYLTLLEPTLKEMEAFVGADLEKEINAVRDELTEWIESEIISRYYFQSGISRHGFRSDLDVIKALEV